MKPEFRSSSFSQLSCVEVAKLPDGRIAVRDSKDPSGRALVFMPAEWAEFIAAAKSDEFDFSLRDAVDKMIADRARQE